MGAGQLRGKLSGIVSRVLRLNGSLSDAHCSAEESILRSARARGDEVTLRLESSPPAQAVEAGQTIHFRGRAAAGGGVARVELLIDGQFCQAASYVYDSAAVDPARGLFPAGPEVAFALDWSTLEVAPGRYRVTVAAWNTAGRCAIAEQTVELAPGPADTVLLICDFPPERGVASVKEIMVARGWALARSGIDHILLQLDDEPPVRLRYGLPRSDVGRDHARFPQSGASGWRHPIDTELIPRGEHTIRVTAVARSGQTKDASYRVYVDQQCSPDYGLWIALNEPVEEDLRRMRDEAARFAIQPTISIAVPVYKTPLDLLKLCIDSVRRQTYPKWELCLADDASADPALAAMLADYRRLDPRIKVTVRDANGGIAAATNSALGLSTGEYFAFLDHDDELAPFALDAVVRNINADPSVDLYYSDEDKIDREGRRFDAFFKPEWSPDYFLSNNYLCHFVVARRWTLDCVGGLDETYRYGAQDYEFLLRVIQHTRRIRRIPKILYHWRAVEGSTAAGTSQKPYASAEGRRALTEYMRRCSPGASVQEFRSCNYRIRYPLREPCPVSILMPTGGNMSLLRTAVEDVIEKTEYPCFEILVVDNSRGRDVEKYIRSIQNRLVTVRYMDWRDMPFNFSTMNNEAVRRAQNPFVLFLNDDMTVIDRFWLRAMVEIGQDPGVGAVGAKLLYPNDLIQHAGVVMGIYGNTGHAFRGMEDSPGVYFGLADVIRNVAAVTAACMLTRRETFWEAGGFDEANLAVAFQDVDYCLTLLEKGYRNVYTPFARLYHWESVTKSEKIPNPVEDLFMKKRWANYIAQDPYYNPNLTRKTEDFALRIE